MLSGVACRARSELGLMVLRAQGTRANWHALACSLMFDKMFQRPVKAIRASMRTIQ